MTSPELLLVGEVDFAVLLIVATADVWFVNSVEHVPPADFASEDTIPERGNDAPALTGTPKVAGAWSAANSLSSSLPAGEKGIIA